MGDVTSIVNDKFQQLGVIRVDHTSLFKRDRPFSGR